MQALLVFSRGIDGLNAWIGRYVIWLILASTVISGVNAIVRKVFNYSSNAFLEVQWYLFASAFLLAAGYTLLQREHVRVDVISSSAQSGVLSNLKRKQAACEDMFAQLVYYMNNATSIKRTVDYATLPEVPKWLS